MEHTDFCKSFYFTEYRYERYHHTDARDGADRHYIGMLEEGRCRIVAEGSQLEAGPGQPFYIPRGLSYQSYWYSEGKIRLRSYGFDHFPEQQNGSFALQRLPESLAEGLRAVPLSGGPDSLGLGAFFTALGNALQAMQRSDRGGLCVYAQAVDYMRGHMDCRVGEVARACGVSESALYAAFRRHGSTPNDTRQSLLVEEAVRLLSTTDAPVQEVSDRLGFSSASYFRKTLHRHTGCSPSQLRRKANKL